MLKKVHEFHRSRREQDGCRILEFDFSSPCNLLKHRCVEITLLTDEGVSEWASANECSEEIPFLHFGRETPTREGESREERIGVQCSAHVAYLS